MESVREAPSREWCVSLAVGTLAKRSVSCSLSREGPDGSGWRGPEGAGAGIEEAELEHKRTRLGWPAKGVDITVVGNHGEPPRVETVKFEAWDTPELVW